MAQQRQTQSDEWLAEQDEQVAPGWGWEPAARVAFWAVLIPAVAYLAGHVLVAVWG